MPVTTLAETLLTAEEFELLPRSDMRQELVRGRIFDFPALWPGLAFPVADLFV